MISITVALSFWWHLFLLFCTVYGGAKIGHTVVALFLERRVLHSWKAVIFFRRNYAEADRQAYSMVLAMTHHLVHESAPDQPEEPSEP